ncbi:MAG: DNA-directed RNA polymerase subunit omega [Bacteroidota bacterium]|jgi:DNA-directed RNA polymerase subunit K/omega
MPIKSIELDKLRSKAKNIYEAIAVMSKRARQINEEVKIEFNQRLETIQTKVTENPEETEVEANPDQLKISYEFERRPKPADIAMKEMLGDKITFRYKEKEEQKKTEEQTE